MDTLQPTSLSYRQIGQLAETVGHTFEIYDDAGRADLGRLLQFLKGKTVFDESPWGSESSAVLADGTFEVKLPRLTSDRRDRFTTAHEVGHLFLHYKIPGRTGEAVFQRGGRGVVETEANYFAASLLMPEQEFRSSFEEFDGDAWALARRFEVSPAAARVRSEVLQLG